jgi:uncharacterized membrane protein YkvA (DUF1232 family)
MENKKATESKETILEKLKKWAGELKKETYALYLACRDPRVPWYAKLLAALVVAHTLSPIDLIPDFIPVIGYLDDLIITPLGLTLAIKLIPAEVINDARLKAESGIIDDKTFGRAGMLIIVSTWIVGLAFIIILLLKAVKD